jgi:leader peptidase (prepilin peptidase)/N-methyltransferase
MTATREAEVRPVASSAVATEALMPIGAVAAAVVCLARVGLTGEGMVAAFVGFVLVWLAVIDIRERILPNRNVLPATAFVLAANIALEPDKAAQWVLSAFAAAAIFLVPALIRPDALGMGDVKLAMLLGAALGPQVVSALALGLFTAGLFAVGLVLARGRAAMKVQVPLGPFLAFGGLVLLLA